MKSYRTKFKVYLNDLGRRKPSPGGGSAVCLVFGIGTSLMEKAIRYSLDLKKATAKSEGKNKRLAKALKNLVKLRNKVYPGIDKDSYLFEKIMAASGKKRVDFIKQSENVVVAVAWSCKAVFFLAKEVESDIKKSIISDFCIGLGLVKDTLLGCILNLEANQNMFGRSNRQIGTLRRFLKKWP